MGFNSAFKGLKANRTKGFHTYTNSVAILTY